jgi:hypothetical protein
MTATPPQLRDVSRCQDGTQPGGKTIYVASVTGLPHQDVRDLAHIRPPLGMAFTIAQLRETVALARFCERIPGAVLRRSQLGPRPGHGSSLFGCRSTSGLRVI